jgi:hypothetical protein
MDHLVVMPSVSSGLARPSPHTTMSGARRGSGRAAAPRLPFAAAARRRAAGPTRRPGVGGAGKACRPRPAPCPARGEEARQRDLQLRVGEEEDPAPRQVRPLPLEGLLSPIAGRLGHRQHPSLGDPKGGSGGRQPSGGAFDAKGEKSRQVASAPGIEGGRGRAQKGLGQQVRGMGTDRGAFMGPAGREKGDLGQTQGREGAPELIFDDVRQGADHQEVVLRALGLGGQGGHQGRQAGVFTLGEGGLDAAARVAEHLHRGP